MRVRAITPIAVSADELERRRSRYRDLSPAGVTIDLENLDGGPPQLDSAAAIEASNALVLEAAAATDPARHDLVLPDCVLDPAVERGVPTPVPVAGILALTGRYLASLGTRFAVVTRNRPIADELEARLVAYGLDRHLAGVHVLDLDIEAIADDRRWNEALRPVVADASRRGVGVVVNGCSAVEVDLAAGVSVVDPTRLALRLLGVATQELIGGAAART